MGEEYREKGGLIVWIHTGDRMASTSSRESKKGIPLQPSTIGTEGRNGKLDALALGRSDIIPFHVRERSHWRGLMLAHTGLGGGNCAAATSG